MTSGKTAVHDKGVSCPVDETDLTQPPMSYRYGDITSPYVPATEPLAVQDGHFVECIATGTRSRTDGRSGLAVVRVLDAAQASLASGRPEPLAGLEPTSAGRRSVVAV